MPRLSAAARRDQLVEVAARLFAERGYRGTTTADLAKAAGVSEPILYRHFDTKLALFLSLVDEIGAGAVDAWRAQLRDVTDPAERLRTLIAAHPAASGRSRGSYRAIMHAMAEWRDEPELARTLRQHLSKLHGFVRNELAELQEAGAARRDQPAAALAWLLLSAGLGYGLVSALGPGRPAARLVQRLLEEAVSA